MAPAPMLLLKDTPLEVSDYPLCHQPGRPSHTVVVKGTFSLVESGECELAPEQRYPLGEMHHADDVAQSLCHPDDLAPAKPRGECLVLGHFHAPEARPVPFGQVTISIGPIQKAIAVFGPRRWTERGPSEAEPVTKVPLRWELAFGGPGSAENPVGRGAAEVPQIEHPGHLLSSPRDRLPPAGFGPIGRGWAPRASMAGTYDALWQATAYPYFPADIDWDFFCSAPLDQRLNGFWRGDEEITLVNLVEGWPRVQCRLPGLRPRAGWVTGVDRGRELRVAEIPLALDTLTVDGDAREVLAIWRGTTPAPPPDAALVVIHGVRDEKTSLTRSAFELLEEKREARAEPEPPAAPAPLPQAPQAPGAAPPPPMVTPSLGDAASRQAGRGPAAGAVAAVLAHELAAPGAGAAPPPLDARRVEALQERARRAEQARVDRSRESKEALETAMRTGERPANWELRDVDLRGVRLENLDLGGADLRGADLGGASLRGCSLDGARLDGANLDGARFEEVSLLEASMSGCEGAELSLVGVNARDAILDGVKLSRVRFLRVRAVGADMTGALLTEGLFEECDLEGVTLDEAALEGARFARTNLADAQLARGALLRGARFEQSNLRGLRASGSNLEEASFSECPAPKARFEGAKLFGAIFFAMNLERADFTGAHLKAARFGRASLRKARFDDADLGGANLLGADLMQARFAGADLRGADLRGANLFQAELLGAKLETARFDLALVTGTRLAPP